MLLGACREHQPVRMPKLGKQEMEQVPDHGPAGLRQTCTGTPQLQHKLMNPFLLK